PPPDFIAHCDVCRSLFFDRMGCDRGTDIGASRRRSRDRADHHGPRRRHLEAQSEKGVRGIFRDSGLFSLDGKAVLPYIAAIEAIMSTLTVTAKGQVTLRKDLLEHLGVQPGEKIVVDKLPDGRIEVKAARPAGKISDVFGHLKAQRKGRTLSIDDMNRIIARGWAGKR